jgi:hypothetical protein
VHPTATSRAKQKKPINYNLEMTLYSQEVTRKLMSSFPSTNLICFKAQRDLGSLFSSGSWTQEAVPILELSESSLIYFHLETWGNPNRLCYSRAEMGTGLAEARRNLYFFRAKIDAADLARQR